MDAKGRNGYFKVHQTSGFKLNDGRVIVSVMSKRFGNSAPIILDGTSEEIRQLGEQLIEYSKKE